MDDLGGIDTRGFSTTPFASSATSSKGAAAVEWLPLEKHPVFNNRSRGVSATAESFSLAFPAAAGARGEINGGDGSRNLAAWDAASSRLYLWDPEGRCLHRLSVRFGEPEGPSSVEAAYPPEILLPDIQLQLSIHFISLNREGSSLLLSGSNGLCIMYMYDRISLDDNAIVCRTVTVGSPIYFGQNSMLRMLQASWHPCSSTHLGILSSDSVLRLYDLSSDLERPEQEYYLQPIEPGKCQNAVSICPVSFTFGGEHLWDRFSVFILFSDGSIYVLCPVVPFGSVFSWPCIKEIYEDADEFGFKLSNSKAVSNSRLAVSWLEATFPELTDQSVDGGSLPVLRAHSYAPLDASLSLQGPLRKVGHSEENENSEVWSADCEGRAVGFLYISISKDSVLMIAWSSGQLQIDALADEVQPLWNVGSSPRLRVNSHGHITAIAMICESNSQELPTLKFSQPLNQGTLNSNMADRFWLGHPPPLLRLAVVDLALPKIDLNNCPLLFSDPLVSERIYCLHGGGIDLIVLHFLPFSNLPATDETAKALSVCPILSTCHSETSSPSLLYGFASIADSFGHSRIVGVTSSCECIVLDMNGWNDILPLLVNMDTKSMGSPETSIPGIISKELLTGPKVVIVPDSSSLRSLTVDSIEGRSALHQYIKLFLENYVEYAHKVYVELKQHGDHLKMILDEQHSRLRETNKLLLSFEDKEPRLTDRINRAVQVYRLLEQRLQDLRNLPGANRKPLSRAEREFKAQLERFRGLELGALHSSIEALNARLRRYQSSLGNVATTPRQNQGKKHVPSGVQIWHLKSSLEKLSLVNGENANKVKLIEHALKSEESDNWQ